MKILVCPLNGPRPVTEFAYGGELRVMPDPDSCSDAQWAAYVFNRSGSPGLKYEWWCHLASGYWFIAQRDTLRDLVVATLPVEAVRAGLGAAAPRSADPTPTEPPT
jgi:sarcosine oxidase subunit delta